MKTTGLHAYRFAENPEEKHFADAWDAEHGPMGVGLLAHLLGDGITPGFPTTRDHVVAATVIQWLGSPVGQVWLRDLGYERREK